MRKSIIAALVLSVGSALAADLPRPAPDFTVQLADGKQATVSSYKGKVLCLLFILTTCPHCQRTTQVLTGMMKDLGPKGFAVLEAAVNDNPDVPGFIAKFSPAFPVGTASAAAALEYIQWPSNKRPLAPFIVFIDRKGMIRSQFSGLDEEFFNDQLEQHIREEAGKLLSEGAGPAKAKAKAASKK